MEALDAQAPALFVMRGAPRGPEKLVFLHGMCGHGLGYAQSFQFSAAKWGTLVAPQGDVRCGAGPWAKWSADVVALDRRIEQAFTALGHELPLEGVLVMGYSQGATRAAALARRFPERYTRLILMGGPEQVTSRGLKHLLGVVTLAGSRDRQDLMRGTARQFQAAGVPATFLVIPNASHGAMGSVPEQTMGEALTWLFEPSKVNAAAP